MFHLSLHLTTSRPTTSRPTASRPTATVGRGALAGRGALVGRGALAEREIQIIYLMHHGHLCRHRISQHQCPESN